MRIILTPDDVLRMVRSRLPKHDKPGRWTAEPEIESLNNDCTGNIELTWEPDEDAE